MASVTLDAIYLSQPPPSTGRHLKARSEGRSTAWKRGASALSKERRNSMASALKISTNADLGNCVDLTSPLPIESVGDPFGEPAMGFGGTENAQGKVLCPWCRWPFSNDFQVPRLDPNSRPVARRTATPSHP